MAQAQQEDGALMVHDGWRYFVHGWTHAVAEVFDLTLTARTVDELAALAETVR
jgi:shikimate dehydrogenase